MRAIFRVVWNICCLRSGPQDLPYSVVLLILLVLINITLSTLQLLSDFSFGQALFQTSAMLGLSLVFTWFLLSLKKLQTRFVQTVSALIATGLVFNLIVYTVFLLQFHALSLDEPTLTNVLINLFLSSLKLALIIWVCVITAHIFKHSLQISFVGGLVVTFAFIGLHVLILQLLLGYLQT